MRVRARRDFMGKEGRVTGGQVLEMSEARFRQLTEGQYIHNPLVDALDVGYKMQSAPLNKMEAAPANKEAAGSSISFRDHRGGVAKEAAKEGAADPTPAPLTGGQTGAVSAASLSEPDLPRQKRKYTRRATAPE